MPQPRTPRVVAVGRHALPLTLALTLTLALAMLPTDAAAQRARQGMLSLETARIYYEVLGTGEPIIVVHGGPGMDHAYLQPGLDALGTRNTLVYYDQRGTGRSAASLDSATINVDAFVEDIDGLRQALGYERVSLLGHSWGALLALEYAARHPEATRALILMNPVEPGARFREVQEERQRRARTAEDSTELATLTQSEGFAAGDPATVSQVYRVMYRQTLRDRTRIDQLDLDLAESTAKNGPEVMRLLGASMGEVDWWDRLPTIRTPTLVLHGRYDLVPSSMSQALASGLGQGRVVVLESGHFPYVEARDALLSAIASFFVDLSR
ncbi:MAG: alpha/beta fold hydrolase [Gemmatimonadetes bacterium]|nr:alpha/beta fold hydrolase [Gemmatimonadota bacterium]